MRISDNRSYNYQATAQLNIRMNSLNKSSLKVSMPNKQNLKYSNAAFKGTGDIVRCATFCGSMGTLIGACITGGSILSLIFGAAGAALGVIIGQDDIPTHKDFKN